MLVNQGALVQYLCVSQTVMLLPYLSICVAAAFNVNVGG